MRLMASMAAIAVAVAWTAPSQAAEFELKISHMFPSTHFIQTLALEPWAKQIEEKSGGRVHFTFFAAGSAFGDATKQFDQARSGVVDVAVGIPSIPRARHPRMVLVELPFTVPDAIVGTCALMKVKDQVKPDFPDTHILSLTVTEPSGVHTKTKVATLDELKGMRVRTPTPAITAMLEYIGATAVGMPPTEIYESVERGVIDGNVMPWGPVGAFKLWEVLNYHLDAAINPVGMYTVINQRKFDSLPEDIRQIIEEASDEVFTKNWGRWWIETDQKAIEAAKANGNEVTPMSAEEREKWRQNLQGVINDYLANESGLDKAEAEAIYAAMGKAVTECQ